MTAPDHLSRHLGGDPTAPAVLLGRPANVRGLLSFPLLVVAASGAWLAIGHVDYRVSWVTPEITRTPVPLGATDAVNNAIHVLVREWLDRLARETRARERLTQSRLRLQHARAAKAKIEQEIADLETEIRKVISDLPEDPGTYEDPQVKA